MKERTADKAGSDVGAIVAGGGGVDGWTMVVSGDVWEGNELGVQSRRRSGTWRMSSPVLVKRK